MQDVFAQREKHYAWEIMITSYIITIAFAKHFVIFLHIFFIIVAHIALNINKLCFYTTSGKQTENNPEFLNTSNDCKH